MTATGALELCTARYPSVRFNEDNLDKVEHHGKALASLGLAATRLRLDVEFFLQQNIDDTEGTKSFLKGVARHLKILLAPTLSLYEEGLIPIRSREVRFVRRRHQAVTIGELLEFARSDISLLENSIVDLRETGRFNKNIFEVEEGEKVPTASPRQTLVRLLVKTRDFQSRIDSDGAKKVLADVSKNLALPSKPAHKELEFLCRIGDGLPKMLFVCYRLCSASNEMIVGAAQEYWFHIPAIKRVRRADRDHRLCHYLEQAQGAYKELQHLENAEENNQKTKYEARRLAVKGMTSSANEYFLHRTKELGQAFDGDKEHQSCYACQGMMGFQTAKVWTDKEKKDVLVQFQHREGYAHACAEVDASLQCSERSLTVGGC